MSKPSSPSLLARLTGRRRAPRAPEPADMGTAFGMEQWLSSPDAEPLANASAKPVVSRSWRSRWLVGSGSR
jgi:hypothetical protein